MSLKFLLDEDHLDLADVIERWNASAEHRIDLVSVGDEEGPPRGTLDDELLIWAEEHGRILITGDKSTLPTWLASHLRTGRASPGIFMLRLNVELREILEFLTLASEAGTPEDFANRVEWIP